MNQMTFTYWHIYYDTDIVPVVKYKWLRLLAYVWLAVEIRSKYLFLSFGQTK